jgi:hypothetical protein
MCLTVDADLLAANGFGSAREFYSAVLGCPIQVNQITHIRIDPGNDGLRSAAEPHPTKGSPVPNALREAG